MGCCNAFLVFFRITEFCLILCCMTLHHQSYELVQDYTLIIITGSLAGYLIIFLGYFASVMQGETIPKGSWILYCLLGVGLFCICTVLAIKYQTSSQVRNSMNVTLKWVDEQIGRHHNLVRHDAKTYGIAKGIVSAVIALALMLDAMLTYCCGD